MDTTTLTAAAARAALDAGEYTAVQLAEAHLAQIAERDGDLHSFLEVYDDVREQAAQADARIASGNSAPLTGIPIAVKDNLLVAGKRVSAASKILEQYVAPYDAFVIEKLKAQGAVLLGRTNMDEFAMGGSTENSAFGSTKNPHALDRVPGGSSGGSAAAVAAGFAPLALGSDTGGSIRQPAALCGCVGLKSTYGTVSRNGLIAMGSSLDQVGPFAKTIADARLLFEAISGHDPADSTSVPDGFYASATRQPQVVGVPRAFLTVGCDPDVLERFEASLEQLRARGITVQDIELPSLSYALAMYYIIMPAEASTNLARFDGIRYGHSVDADTIREVYEQTRGDGFGTEVKRRILTGTFVLSSGYVDAYYRRAQSLRDQLRADFARAFESVDAIALPTSPTPAFKLGEKSDPIAMYAADIFTVPVNLAGVPAISVPNGTVDREGDTLPVGFQLIATHGGEDTLFTLGELIEART